MAALHGKTALITGGGSGIGAAIAEAFVGAGAQVVITGRTEEKLAQVAHRLGSACMARVCNGADGTAVDRTVAGTLEHFRGHLDILVNNAGLNLKQRTVRELSPLQWCQVMEANVNGAFYFIKAVLGAMSAQKDGLIINITSVAGKRVARLSGTAYSASKFAMQALSLSVGLEEKEHGIRCTAIVPGEVDTPILLQRPEPVSAERRKQILQPEDVAAAALFVATLPSRVNIPELIITPTSQAWT